MNKNAFWAFFVIALVAGFAVGMFFSNSGIIGRAISSETASPGAEVSTFGETDAGLDYSTFGTCTDSIGVHNDFCMNTGTVGEQFFNEANQMCSTVAFSCILAGYKKCANGICVSGTSPSIPVAGQKQVAVQTEEELQNIMPVAPEPEPLAGAGGAVEIPVVNVFHGPLSAEIFEEINSLQEEHEIIEKTECMAGRWVTCCWGPGCEHGCCWVM